jgi:hypothetical protein
MSYPSSTLNFEPADPGSPASSAGTSSVFPLPAHASPTSTLGVPGSYAESAIDHTSGSRPSEMAATLLRQPVIDLVAWLRNRYLPQDLAIPGHWDQQLTALIDCLCKSVDDPDATTAFAWFLNEIRDLDSSSATAHEVTERETQRMFQLALTYKSNLENAGRTSASLASSAPQQPATTSKRRRQQHFSPETLMGQQSFSAMQSSDTMILGSTARWRPPNSPAPSFENTMAPSSMRHTPVSRSLQTYEQNAHVLADMGHHRFQTVAEQTPVVPDYEYTNPQSSFLHAFQPEIADIRPYNNVPQFITNTQIWPEPTEPLLTCTHGHRLYGHEPVQLLTGVYAKLFRYIYQGQTGKVELEWDVFLPENRLKDREGKTRLNSVFPTDFGKSKALAFLTQCRRLVYETHHNGNCWVLQHEFRKRGVYPPSWSEKSLRDTFEELQKLEWKHWSSGERPKLFDDGD